ncbi:hypothetical protein HQ587_03095 [bacterium]|nr:hypothetical protein [bacterium]
MAGGWGQADDCSQEGRFFAVDGSMRGSTEPELRRKFTLLSRLRLPAGLGTDNERHQDR